MTLLDLLHQHHRVEAALIDYIRDGMPRDKFDASALRKVHDMLEGDILYEMAGMTEEAIQAVLTQYEDEGGYL